MSYGKLITEFVLTNSNRSFYVIAVFIVMTTQVVESPLVKEVALGVVKTLVFKNIKIKLVKPAAWNLFDLCSC